MKRRISLLFIVTGLFACSPQVPVKYIVPDPKPGMEDTGFESYEPEVDILFVVDDSGSMTTHQTNLAVNIDKFLKAFTSKVRLDFHIGVMSTSVDYNGKGGELKGQPKYVVPTTPNLVNTLARNLKLGISGSGYEKMFDPIHLGLTEPLLSGFNKGFYRPTAALAVVFITDAEDQSEEMKSAKELFQFLEKLKGGSDRIFLYGVIIPYQDLFDCERDEPNVTPDRLEELLKLSVTSGSNVMNLCDPNFSDNLMKMGQDLALRTSGAYYLKRKPVPGSIRVTYGAIDIPSHPTKGWTYDPAENAVVIGKDFDWDAQPLGSKIKVFYKEVEVID